MAIVTAALRAGDGLAWEITEARKTVHRLRAKATHLERVCNEWDERCGIDESAGGPS